MRYILFLLSILIMLSCTENDTKTDKETNTYYAKHKYIYDNLNSLSFNESLTLMDEYLQEFPNAKEMYKLKAYLFAVNNRFEDCIKTLESYDESDEEKLKTKDYLVSLLLMDTTQIKRTKEIIANQQKNQYKSVQQTYNNYWIALYEKNFSQADSLSNYLLNQENITHKFFLRTPILTKAAQHDTLFVKTKIDSFNLEKKVKIMLDSLARKQISLEDYYKKLSK